MLQESVIATALSGLGSVWLWLARVAEVSPRCWVQHVLLVNDWSWKQSKAVYGNFQTVLSITFLWLSHSLQALATESEVRIDTHSVHVRAKGTLTGESISIDVVTQWKFLLPGKILLTAKSFFALSSKRSLWLRFPGNSKLYIPSVSWDVRELSCFIQIFSLNGPFLFLFIILVFLL